jgi:CRP-like cAMP-binding protein
MGYSLKKLDETLLIHLLPFSQLDRGQIREILDLATSKRHDEGTAIFSAGMAAERFFLLLDGTIRVIRTTKEGEQVIVLHISPGQLFGIAPAIGATAYPASAMAADECLTLSWPVRLWPDFTTRYPGFATAVHRMVGVRLEEMHSRIAELSTRQVEQRVSAALLRMVQQSGKKVDEGIEIDFPVTRLNISEMTGTTLHTVSRLLSAWEKDGIVASRRRHIVVTDPHRLVLLSTPPAAD